MKKENLHKPFEIVYLELDESPPEGHTHSFFELVYIVAGNGLQCINNGLFEYGPGHLFLITPTDCHSFDVRSSTHFLIIRFNKSFLSYSQTNTATSSRITFILEHASHRPGCILANKTDKKLVQPIAEALIRERTNHQLYGDELVIQLVNTLLVIVARNLALSLPEQINTATESRTLDILEYIQQNIYYPEKLRTKEIAAHFGISEFYLGRYFRKHTGESFLQYISGYKLRLIESRLLYTEKRINEIAAEFGFTDESHLNKFFRNHRQVSPKEFRNSTVKDRDIVSCK